MKRIDTLFCAFILLLSIASVYAQPQIGSPWPMIHHDQYHTGRSPYNGPEDSTVKWTFTTRGQIGPAPAIAADGTIYVASQDEHLYAVNPDGTEKWRFSMLCGESSPAIGLDGTIYVGNDITTGFHAINPDGTEKWTYDFGGAIAWPSPTIGEDGRIYVSTYGNATLYALTPSGTADWTYSPFTADLFESPSINPDGTIYIRGDNGRLYAFTPSGSVLWEYFEPGFGGGGGYQGRTSFSVEESTIYLGGQAIDAKLYAIGSDSVLQWTFSARGPISAAPAIGEDGTIYFGAYDSTFYALYPGGNLKWDFRASGKIYSSAVIDSDGTIYFATDPGGNNSPVTSHVYALTSEGSLLWSYELPYGVWGSPAIGADGTLYIPCRDGKLYAFGTPITAVEERDQGSVVSNQLHQNHPNPFFSSNRTSIIRYGLAHSGEVSLKIYDLTGRLVRTLMEGEKKAGIYSIPWDGQDLQGRKVTSGIYFYRLKAADFTATKKLILLR